MSVKTWFEGRTRPKVDTSPLVPLAARVQQQAEELQRTTALLNKMISEREAGYEPPPR